MSYWQRASSVAAFIRFIDRESLRGAQQIALCKLDGMRAQGTSEFFRARFYCSTKIRFLLIFPLWESCWGVPSPKPYHAAVTI